MFKKSFDSAAEYMEHAIHSVDERSVWWKLEAFESKFKTMDLIHAAVDISWDKLLKDRSPDAEIEYTRSKLFFIARVKMVSAEGYMKRITH